MAVRRELSTLSLATVYKTLDSLARVGAVRRVRGARPAAAGTPGWNPITTSCASNMGACVTCTTPGSTR